MGNAMDTRTVIEALRYVHPAGADRGDPRPGFQAVAPMRWERLSQVG
jgi:hypothetical protein